METPSHTLFADLKAFGHISNHDAAMILLSPEACSNGIPIRSRASTDRTFLSREIVHALPGRYGIASFNSFPRTAQQLETLVLSRLKDEGKGLEEFSSHYREAAGRSMCAAISGIGQDSNLYRNALERIQASEDLSDATKAHLAFMLFVVTGCLGIPSLSVEIVSDYAEQSLSCRISTVETQIGSGYAHAVAASQHDVCLGLLRIVDGEARPPIHPLSLEPEGSIIGALAAGPGGITDVGNDVSRQHARIWREDGTWWVQGLGSTNVTMLISGDTHEPTIVELPRSKRTSDETPAPVEIANSDLLRLGSTTDFLVMRIADSRKQEKR